MQKKLIFIFALLTVSLSVISARSASQYLFGGTSANFC
jgi:hypothetical protein